MEGHCAMGKRCVPGADKSCNVSEPQCLHLKKGVEHPLSAQSYLEHENVENLTESVWKD